MAIKDGDRTATHQLVGLSIIESSLVTAGDNPEAHIVTTKAKSEGNTPPAPARDGARVGVPAITVVDGAGAPGAFDGTVCPVISA